MIKRDERFARASVESRHIKKNMQQQSARQLNQRKYRERKKQRHQKLEHDVIALREKVSTFALYNSALSRRTLCRTDHAISTRCNIINCYASIVRFGADKRDVPQYSMQKSFFKTNFHPDFSLGGNFKRGFDALLKQWEMYTQFHDQLTVQNICIQQLNAQGDSFRLTILMEMVITE